MTLYWKYHVLSQELSENEIKDFSFSLPYSSNLGCHNLGRWLSAVLSVQAPPFEDTAASRLIIIGGKSLEEIIY